jgi:thioesterase domain-containing protein
VRGGVFESATPNSRPPETCRPKSQAPSSSAGGVSSAGLSAVVPLRTEGTKPPLFVVHGVDGTLPRFHVLVRHLEPDRPIYGIQSQALLGETVALTSVEELAAYYIQGIQAVVPHGPYHFLGFSFGGLVAFEMARQLRDRGEQVGMLGMLDNLRMGRDNVEGPAPMRNTSSRLGTLAENHATELLGPRGLSYATAKLVSRSLRTIYRVLRARRKPIPRFLRSTYHINWFAAVNYVPQSYPGSITLFPACGSTNAPVATNDFWARLAGGGMELHYIPGSHEEVLSEPNVITLAKALSNCLASIDSGQGQGTAAVSLVGRQQ